MYKRSEQGWLKHYDFILLDMLSLQIALALAYCLRFGFSHLVYADEKYTSLALWMLVFSVLNLVGTLTNEKREFNNDVMLIEEAKEEKK